MKHEAKAKSEEYAYPHANEEGRKELSIIVEHTQHLQAVGGRDAPASRGA